MVACPRSLHVLVVDDESLIRWAVSRTLARAGHVVSEAEDGATALAMVTVTRPPDVVILDYRLAVIHGKDLVSALQQLAPDTAIVIMTAEGSDVTAAAGMDHLCILRKPFDVNHVEAVLFAAMDVSRRWRAFKTSIEGGRESPERQRGRGTATR